MIRSEAPAIIHAHCVRPDVMPHRATPESTGLDLRANLEYPAKIHVGEVMRIPTGFFVELPLHHAGLICPRSGLAEKHRVSVMNAPGLIDPDYRGEVGVLLYNRGNSPFMIEPGDRIAQFVVIYTPPFVFSWVDTPEELAPSYRGTSGFGSSGIA